MSRQLSVCLDLNIWCAALLADAKGTENSACQSIVDIVRYGRCHAGTVKLIVHPYLMINWLNQCDIPEINQQYLLQGFL